jgi:hypothetical protein
MPELKVKVRANQKDLVQELTVMQAEVARRFLQLEQVEEWVIRKYHHQQRLV